MTKLKEFLRFVFDLPLIVWLHWKNLPIEQGRFFHSFNWYVVGISGGKDSTALLLWLKYEHFPKWGISHRKLKCIFNDTGWEADVTYAHVQKINDELHPVVTLTSGETFLELAARKKRFPWAKMRFCTQELKLKPAKAFMNSLSGKILSVNGIRREESKVRSEMSEFGSYMETYHGSAEWRPLLEWKIEDIWLIHKRYNFTRNPLYDMGFERVGCMPCIMSQKKEIRLMAKHFPERITMIRDAENSSQGSRGFSSLFPARTVPDRYCSKTFINKKGNEVKVATIDDVVTWSNTSDNKHGSNFDFHFEDFEETTCQQGVCE